MINEFISEGVDQKFIKLKEHSQKLITHIMKTKNIPGLSIAFYHKDNLYSEGFGYADLENKIVAKPDTVYLLGSVMKPMTALAIMKLSETVLDIEDEVQRYVTFYPKKKWPITIRQILGHMSGLSWKTLEWKKHYDKIQYTTREVIDLFKDNELEFKPGTKYEYSSLGYNLLGAVIEEVSGVPYEEYMKSNIWKPLKMDDTQLDTRQIIMNRARGYDYENGTLLNSVYINNSLWFAAGGGRSTVLDLLKLSKGLDNETILPHKVQNQMYEPMILIDGTKTDYGLGWRLNKESDYTIIHHGGGQPGTTTHLLRVPSLDFGLAIGCNLGYVDQIKEMAFEIEKIFIKIN
ncbi:beta-lactamase family protein [Candidatus Bathyarchaeota archaeon]|nr:beta-lactamase family protein [Candidatus Bathyarchaeota archaeon]